LLAAGLGKLLAWPAELIVDTHGTDAPLATIVIVSTVHKASSYR